MAELERFWPHLRIEKHTDYLTVTAEGWEDVVTGLPRTFSCPVVVFNVYDDIELPLRFVTYM